jgi:phage shock protein A
MPFFPRTRDIQIERVDEILATAEDRDRVLRLIVKDVEEALAEARGREAVLLQRARQFGQDVEALESRHAELTEKARHALVEDREDVARHALHAKYASVGDAAGLRQSMGILDARASAIAVEVTRLETVLAEVKARRPLTSRD